MIPTNSDWTFEDMEGWKTIEGLVDRYPEQAKVELGNIRGKIVLFPPSHKSLKKCASTIDPWNNLHMFVNFDDSRRIIV